MSHADCQSKPLRYSKLPLRGGIFLYTGMHEIGHKPKGELPVFLIYNSVFYIISPLRRIAGNFRGHSYFFVDNTFVAAACTAGKGRHGRFIHE